MHTACEFQVLTLGCCVGALTGAGVQGPSYLSLQQEVCKLLLEAHEHMVARSGPVLQSVADRARDVLRRGTKYQESC